MDREEADRREAGREGMSGPAPTGEARPRPESAIRLDAVVRTQGSFTLGPLDMTVPVGMVTGFVGPNGAGKTTPIKAMLGMVGLDAGSIGVLDGGPGARRQGGQGPAQGLAPLGEGRVDDGADLHARLSYTSPSPRDRPRDRMPSSG